MNMNRPCGCNIPMPEMYYNNVVKKCFVEEVPHVVNYNTHVINECVKKHITIPNYTCSEETVCIDEFQFRPMQIPYQYPPITEQVPTQNMTQMPNVPNTSMPNAFNPFQF